MQLLPHQKEAAWDTMLEPAPLLLESILLFLGFVPLPASDDVIGVVESRDFSISTKDMKTSMDLGTISYLPANRSSAFVGAVSFCSFI